MKNATIPFSLPAVINQGRYILVIYTGGWPSNHPPKVARIISCDDDADYYTIHAPRDGERGRLIPRDHQGTPSLKEVWDIQHGIEAELAAR